MKLDIEIEEENYKGSHAKLACENKLNLSSN